MIFCVLVMLIMKSGVFWDMTPCSLVDTSVSELRRVMSVKTFMQYDSYIDEDYCSLLRVASLEAEQAGLVSQLSQSETIARDLQQQWDRTRTELTYSHSELDQYRVRAQRILQDKERLIAELRGQGSISGNVHVFMLHPVCVNVLGYYNVQCA
jgi:hypothetical protein